LKDDGMCFEINQAKGGTMQTLKKMIEDLITGIKNKIGPDGSFAGKYQMAVYIFTK
jgi:hypothetical protein